MTSMVEEAKGSAFMKDSLRGTVLEVKKEQDWRGQGRGREGGGGKGKEGMIITVPLYMHSTPPPHLNVYATDKQGWVQGQSEPAHKLSSHSPQLLH